MAEANLDLRREATSVHTARRFVERILLDWHQDALMIKEATLLASELVSNAVLHAATNSSTEDLQLRLRRIPDGIRIEVVDGSPAPPIRRPASVGGGRGLLIVETIAARWGTLPHPGGKVVWFELGHDRGADP